MSTTITETLPERLEALTDRGLNPLPLSTLRRIAGNLAEYREEAEDPEWVTTGASRLMFGAFTYAPPTEFDSAGYITITGLDTLAGIVWAATVEFSSDPRHESTDALVLFDSPQMEDCRCSHEHLSWPLNIDLRA